MEYIKIRFGKDLLSLHSRLSRTIDEMCQQVNPPMALPKATWRPEMDLYETSDQVVILAELPGVENADLEVEVEPEAAKISGVRWANRQTPGIRYHLAEIGYGRFERILRLPEKIVPERVEASYKNGILAVIMPKQATRGKRRIQVQQG